MKQKILQFLKSRQRILSLTLKLHSFIYFLFFFRNKGKGNKFNYPPCYFKNTVINVEGNNNLINFGSFSTFHNCKIIVVGNNNNITIGNKVRFNGARFWLDQNNNSITIGDRCTIRGNSLIGVIEGTQITIGEDCMFADNIDIRTGDSHSIINSIGVRINKSQNIKIGNHVWLAKNVTCLKGVTIADNCIVGANSLLTKNYEEPNTLILGSPAKIVKSKIDWLRERI